MEIVNKLPRWVLIVGFLGFMLLGGFMLRGAFADLDTTKARSLKTEQSVNELSAVIDEVKKNLSTFSEKYDRNQEENQKVFRQILLEVKK